MIIDNPIVSGSLNVQNAITASNITIASTASAAYFTGSFVGDGTQLSGVTSYTDADTLTYINNLGVLSGSAQIATEISGAFDSVSSSLAQRVAAQEDFSSSLDATFATDAELSAVSGALASDIADIIDGTQTATSASYAVSSSYSNYAVTSSLSDYALDAAHAASADEAINSSKLNNLDSTQFLRSDQTGTLTGDLTVTGTLTAQEFHTEFVSASILFESGSTKFGDTLDDTHTFTGSINLTGSLVINGAEVGTGKLDESIFNSYTSSTDTRLDIAEGSITSLNSATSSYALQNSISGAFNSVSSSIATDISNIVDGTTQVASASLAQTASYIDPTFISSSAAASGFGQGGVTEIIAGSGISINQGTGAVTVTALAASGSQGQNVIAPFAYAHITLNNYTANSGIGLSWGNYQYSAGNYGYYQFTFANAQPNSNYAVMSDMVVAGDINISAEVTNRTTTGFRVNFYDSNGTELNVGSVATYEPIIQVYGSDPIATVGVAITGSLVNTGSLSSNTLTFTKGDGTTFDIDLSTIQPTSASYALTASYALNAGGGTGAGFPYEGDAVITGSLFVSGGLISGSFKGDGSQLSNITVSQTATVRDTFTNVISKVVNHNFNSKNVNVSVYDENDQLFFPKSVTLTDNDNVTLEFSLTSSGAVVVSRGGHIVSGSVLVPQAATATDTFTSATSVTVTHNLDSRNVIVSVYDDNNLQIIPESVELTDLNTVTVTFPIAKSGTVVVAKGGHIVSGSVPFENISNLPTLVSSSLQFNDITSPFTGSFTGSFYGDGSNLSGVTSYTDADTLAFINSKAVLSGSIAELTSVTASFVNTGSVTIPHSFNSKNVSVSVYDSSDILILPQEIALVSNNAVKLTFGGLTSGFAVVSKGGHIVSGSVLVPQVSHISDTFTSATSHTVNHKFNTKEVIVSVYEGDTQIIPDTVTTDDLNNVTVTFPEAISGRVVVVKAGHIVSGSLAFDNLINSPFEQGTSAVTASKHIVPSQDQTYDLGSPSLRFRDIYLSSASIYLGNTTISEGNIVTTASLQSVLPQGVISGSNQLAGETIDGDLTITGKVTAQEFHTEFVSASIIYQSGSTQFGDSADDTHIFTGNVGIGNSSPSYKLSLRESGATAIYSEYLNNSDGKAAYLGLTSAGRYYIGTNDEISFHTSVSYSERMRIDSSGNVGIGESGPLGKLHIKGSDTGVTIPSAQGNLLVLEDAENGLSILSSTAGAGYINFGDSDDNDVGMIIYGHSSNAMSFWTNAGKRMTIDSSGNVGIGTSSPDTKLIVVGGTSNTPSTSTSDYSMSLQDPTSMTAGVGGSILFQGYKIGTSAIGNFGYIAGKKENATSGNEAGYLSLGTSNSLGILSERMRITSVGDVLIGTTTTSDTSSGLRIVSSQMRQSIPGTGLVDFHDFYRGTEGSLTRVGNIRADGSSTSYNTTSDYRLKENVVEMTGALDRVDLLKPSRFNFIADPENTVDGFLAHEVAEVVPEAITGVKDEVDEDGNPVYQGIDQSKLVPLLVAAIKELKAEIQLLKNQ